jgi:hypothetical protein
MSLYAVCVVCVMCGVERGVRGVACASGVWVGCWGVGWGRGGGGGRVTIEQVGEGADGGAVHHCVFVKG